MRELFDYIAREWAVLRGAPGAFIGLAVVFLLAGVGIAKWHYSERIDAQEGQLRRYRVALGIDKASRGTLVELSNQELRAMADNIVPKIRELCFSFRRRSDEVDRVTNPKDPASLRNNYERLTALGREVSEQYDRSFRSDRVLLNNEMLRRLDRKAAGAVIRVPMFDAETGAPISLYGLPATGQGILDAGLMCAAADETEQLSKLLPADQKR